VEIDPASPKGRFPRRKPRGIPELPHGLTLHEQLNYISRPVTAQVLAELLGVSPITLYKLAQRGEIPHDRVGGTVRFCTRSVARWLRGGPALQRRGAKSEVATVMRN